MSRVTINCPCCQRAISGHYTPGRPAVWYPNDKATPEEPPEFITDAKEGCGCWDYHAGNDERYYNDLMAAIAERMEDD
jgi:hypothetical protein